MAETLGQKLSSRGGGCAFVVLVLTREKVDAVVKNDGDDFLMSQGKKARAKKQKKQETIVLKIVD